MTVHGVCGRRSAGLGQRSRSPLTLVFMLLLLPSPFPPPPRQVLGVGLQRLMDRSDRPLPELYVRAMLLSLNAFPKLREKTVELLAELASPVRQVSGCG